MPVEILSLRAKQSKTTHFVIPNIQIIQICSPIMTGDGYL